MLTLSKSKHDLEVTKMGSLMSLLLLFIYIEVIISEIKKSITYMNKIYLSIYKAIQSDEMKVKVTVK